MLNNFEEAFLVESNKIEGIMRPTFEREKLAFRLFVDLPSVGIEDLKRLVSVFQPNAKLRDQIGLDVVVGSHTPVRGGSGVLRSLMLLLEAINDRRIDPYWAHVEYEILHPFTDCNGRSGRMLWWRSAKNVERRRGFLHSWYYLSLQEAR